MSDLFGYLNLKCLFGFDQLYISISNLYFISHRTYFYFNWIDRIAISFMHRFHSYFFDYLPSIFLNLVNLYSHLKLFSRFDSIHYYFCLSNFIISSSIRYYQEFVTEILLLNCLLFYFNSRLSLYFFEHSQKNLERIHVFFIIP